MASSVVGMKPRSAGGTKAPQNVPKRTEKQTEDLVKRLVNQKQKVVFHSVGGGSFTIRGYTDRNGRKVTFESRYISGRTEPRVKANVFKDDGSEYGPVRFAPRSVQVHWEDDKIIEALLNHPECVGSINKRGMSTFFVSDVQGDKAAKLDEMERKSEAGNIAMSLKGFELALVAAHYGVTSKDPSDHRLAVLGAADENALAFRDLFVKDTKGWKMREDEAIPSIVSLAIRYEVISRPGRGDLFSYGDTTLGGQRVDIINRLAAKPEILAEVEAAVKKALGQKN